MMLSRRSLVRALPLAAPALLLAPVTARGATYTVGQGGTVASLSAVPWSRLGPGDEVVLRPGRHTSMIVLSANGTPSAPIVIRAESGAVLANSVVLEGAQHVRLQELVIEQTRLSGVIIRRGAAFITVHRCTVRAAGLGVWIGDGAGPGHRVTENALHDTKTHGIAIDVVNMPKGQETLIARNRVARNVMHGMEINGNGYIVEENLVWDNGLGLSGTSGIHTFCRTPQQNAGRDNIIRYNTVWGQRETTGQDGNGIQLDQWCDRNQVYFNLCFGNDGAGIVLFDASDNLVANNTLIDNMRDSGGRHAYKADLVMASDYTKNVDAVRRNRVVNNLVVTRRRGIASIYVDPFAARATTEIAGNMVQHEAGEVPLIWNRARMESLAAWNAAKPGAADGIAAPVFPEIARLNQPIADPSGARPRAGSLPNGLPNGVAAQRDLLGTPFTTPPVGALVPR